MKKKEEVEGEKGTMRKKKRNEKKRRGRRRRKLRRRNRIVKSKISHLNKTIYHI